MTLVDTNVLLDILSKEAKWFAWSLDNLTDRLAHGALIINEILYAELSARVASEADLDASLVELDVRLERTPKHALFVAGKAFQHYRRAGGTRTGVLPDLFIGAHAQVAAIPLLTRETDRYRTYFPDVELIAPAA